MRPAAVIANEAKQSNPIQSDECEGFWIESLPFGFPQ
jgi:hypothetical protein